MKKNILYIVIILASFLLNACKDEYDPTTSFKPSLTAHYLRPSKTSFGWEYWYRGFNETFEVESSATSWTFTNTPNWVSLTPHSSNKSETVNISANDNPFAENRTAIFYLSSAENDWEYSRAMSVSQGKADPYISVEKDYLSFGGGSGTQTILVSSNCKWSVSNNYQWISSECDNENGILSISVTPNPSASYRTGYIYVKYENYSVGVTITQGPSGITSSQSTLNYENVASAYKLSIDAEADWSTSTSDSWIKVSPSSGGAGVSEVTIEVTPNTNIGERKGFVTFYTNGNSKLQIEIIQRGLYIEADEELNFSHTGETLNLNVFSNTDWQIISAPNWISLSKTEGTGNSNISVVAQENKSSIERSGQIILGQSGLDLNFTVSVKQGRKYLVSNMNVLDFSDKPGTSSFRIISNSNWSSSFEESWFAVTPMSGTGNCDIEVTVEENNSSEERIGTIKYLYADDFENVNIHQLAKYLTIDNQTFDFSSNGGTHTIDICTNDKWTAEFEHPVSWLHLSSKSGNGDTKLVLTADDNPTIKVRSTAVIIKSENSQDVRILVSQQPKTLKLSTSKILFFSEGGRSEVITINTEGKYKIQYDSSWFTVNESNDNSFTVYAAENKNNDYRQGKITITLTDLVDCSLSIELSVVQVGVGGSFIINGFEEDKDWDLVTMGNLTISIFGYKSDTNWNNIPGGSLKVNITGYTTDNDWNIKDLANGRATIIRYGNDNDWNNTNNGSGQINKDDYQNDTNWNNEYNE